MTTVTVSLKHPNGILMKVGNREIKINGWNSDNSLFISPTEKVGVTPDVPADLWKAWLESHKNHPLHKNGLIFANTSESKVKAEAKERTGVKSGMEQIDPKNVKSVKTFTNED